MAYNPNNIPHVATLAALRAIPANAAPGYSAIYLDGIATLNDGGNGVWEWTPTSTDTDNTGTIINPTGNSGNGRWMRQYQGPVLINWWGANRALGADCAAFLFAAFSAASAVGNRQVAALPGRYLLSTQVFDGSVEMPPGMEFFTYGEQNSADGVDGTDAALFRWSGTEACFDLRRPNGTQVVRGWNVHDISFSCLTTAGQIWSINYLDMAGNDYTPTNDASTPQYILPFTFNNVYAEGGGFGSMQTGDYLRAKKTFHINISGTCNIRSWRIGVLLTGCDNCEINSRFLGNTRHVQLTATNTFGNDNALNPRFSGQIVAGSISGYHIFDQAQHTQIGDCEFENGVEGTAILLLDGTSTRIGSATFNTSAAVPFFELGANGRDIIAFGPTSNTVGAPIIRNATNYDGLSGSGIVDIGITIVTPNKYLQIVLNGLPRVLIQEPDLLGLPLVRDGSNLNIGPNGPNTRSTFVTPSNFWGGSASYGWQPISSIGPDVDSNGVSFGSNAIFLSTTNLSGFAAPLIAGVHFSPGDTVQCTLFYRMFSTPTTGSLKFDVRKNTGTPTQTTITNSSTYTMQNVVVSTAGYAINDSLNISVFNSASDAMLVVGVLCLDVVQANVADTSSATLAALETSLNSVKAVLRNAKIMAAS